jgi:hypothetical protein
VQQYTRHEMLDIVKIDGKARGIIARDLVSGKLERHFGHAVLIMYWWIWQCILSIYQCNGFKRNCCLESTQTRCVFWQSMLSHKFTPLVFQFLATINQN